MKVFLACLSMAALGWSVASFVQSPQAGAAAPGAGVTVGGATNINPNSPVLTNGGGGASGTPSGNPSGGPSGNPSPGPSHSPSPSPRPSPSVSPSISPRPSGSPAVAAATVMTTTGSLGEYLVDGAGKSLYVFQSDTPNSGQSACTGACSGVWPPLTVPAGQAPTASGDAQQNLLGTITRPDGAAQVTYAGLPLYYYAPDINPGDTKGQGINSFGNFWYLDQPNGQPLTGGGGGGAGTVGTSGGGGGGGGGGY